MQTIFFLCALIGGTVMLCQFAMTLLGMGGDTDLADDFGGGDLHSADFSADTGDLHTDAPTDVDHHRGSGGGDLTDALDRSHGHGQQHSHSSNWFFVKLTFQTGVAALAFFGLGGMAAKTGGLPPWGSLAVAALAGVSALYIVYWLMELLHRFNSDGNVHIGNAVGLSGTVYVSIPPKNSGAGKILINLQNRTVELRAMSTSPLRLAPGAKIVVQKVLEPGLVEVTPAEAAVELAELNLEAQ